MGSRWCNAGATENTHALRALLLLDPSIAEGKHIPRHWSPHALEKERTETLVGVCRGYLDKTLSCQYL